MTHLYYNEFKGGFIMGVNEYIQIGSRIKSLRINKGYTQAYMAKQLNIPRSSYANYENNRREPSMEIIRNIAKFFDIPISSLLEGPSSMTNLQICLADSGTKNLPIPKFEGKDQIKFNQLVSYFAKLTPAGKDKLVSYAKDLTLIPNYIGLSKKELDLYADSTSTTD